MVVLVFFSILYSSEDDDLTFGFSSHSNIMRRASHKCICIKVVRYSVLNSLNHEVQLLHKHIIGLHSRGEQLTKKICVDGFAFSVVVHLQKAPIIPVRKTIPIPTSAYRRNCYHLFK